MWFKKKKELPFYTRAKEFSKLLELYAVNFPNKILSCTIGYKGKLLSCLFASKNGDIEIVVVKDTILKNNTYTIYYTNLVTGWRFSIKANKDKISAEPNLGNSVKAKDIDLAMYEFENYVKNYQVSLSDKEKHNSEIDLLANNFQGGTVA